MDRIERKEIDRIIDKLDDFSEKFPLLSKEDINIKQLSKYWGEQTSKVKAVLELLIQSGNMDFDIDEVERVYYQKNKGNKKIIFKNGEEKEIKKTD